MEFIQKYNDAVEQYILQTLPVGQPASLYEPIAPTLMSLGGKRTDRHSVLLSCDLFHGKWEDALPAAYAMEVFQFYPDAWRHYGQCIPLTGKSNGTWEIRQQYSYISAGMLCWFIVMKCWHLTLTISSVLIKSFNTMALHNCEGQRMDMDFETREDVKVSLII